MPDIHIPDEYQGDWRKRPGERHGRNALMTLPLRDAFNGTSCRNRKTPVSFRSSGLHTAERTSATYWDAADTARAGLVVLHAHRTSTR
jgi:hypothetical protein